MINTAKKWIGYLEHQTPDLLGVYTANAGKGGCTIFAEIISRHYRWRNFMGLPWCVTFVYAVFIETYGKAEAKRLLGKPRPGTRALVRHLKRRGKLCGREYAPKVNDLIFLTNDSGDVEHCGIVIDVKDDLVITIEGNTTDPTGTFQNREGGAVAQRVRRIADPSIICYGGVR